METTFRNTNVAIEGSDALLDALDLAGEGLVSFGGYSESGLNAAGLRSDGYPLGYGCGTAGLDGWIPDRIGSMDFLPACIAHDQCYDTGTTVPRGVCDARLGDDIQSACQLVDYPYVVCVGVGMLYQWSATLFGASAYNPGATNAGGIP